MTKAAVVGVAGLIRTGKTQTLRNIILQNKQCQFVVFDSAPIQSPQFLQGRMRGGVFVHKAGSLCASETVVVRRMEHIAGALKGKRVVVYQDERDAFTKPTLDAFLSFCTLNLAGVVVVLDEVDVSEELGADTKKIPLHWKVSISKGAHVYNLGKRGISLLWCVQDIGQLNRYLLGQTSIVFVHKTNDPLQIRKLQARFQVPFDGDRLARMEKYRCFRVDVGERVEPVQGRSQYKITDFTPKGQR
mgnify:CR=1 FL=1